MQIIIHSYQLFLKVIFLLNYIQVKLLKECRKNNNQDLFDPLLRTIHAIAKGMKNTG